MAEQNPNLVGKLVSGLDHTVTISYKGDGLAIPPRGCIKNVKRTLLGNLPRGVQFIRTKRGRKR